MPPLRSISDLAASSITFLLFIFPLTTTHSQTIAQTTVYVGNHFEVRDHDQPTKYVFNGPTRVAALTGSLSAGSRVQRIRLYEGWNLISVAVTATNLAGQLGQTVPAGVGAIYEWSPLTGQYSSVLAGHSVLSGSVLWVRADTNLIATIFGTYSDPVDQQVTPGGAYVSGTGLEAWTPLLPGSDSGWFYEAQTKQWREQLSGPLAVVSDPPWTLAPGQVIYVKSDVPAVLPAPDPTLRLQYYHEDHLGSSSVITDQTGKVVEELAFYPFGSARNLFKPRQMENPYQFTQKERDRESGLDYFGRRFYAAQIGRWISPDPLGEQGGGMNLYAYVNEKPLNHFDPDGAEVKVTYTESGNRGVYKIDVKAVVVNASSHTFSKQELQSYAKSLEQTIKSSYSGSASGKFANKFNDHKGTVSWSTTVSIEVIDDPSKLKPDDPRHVFRIVNENQDERNHPKGSAAGTAAVGGRVMNIDLASFTQKQPSEVDESVPGNKGYARGYQSPQTVGAHELGHDLGLDDIKDESNILNLMSEYRLNDSAVINEDQIAKIYKQYNSGKLNQSDEKLINAGKTVH